MDLLAEQISGQKLPSGSILICLQEAKRASDGEGSMCVAMMAVKPIEELANVMVMARTVVAGLVE